MGDITLETLLDRMSVIKSRVGKSSDDWSVLIQSVFDKVNDCEAQMFPYRCPYCPEAYSAANDICLHIATCHDTLLYEKVKELSTVISYQLSVINRMIDATACSQQEVGSFVRALQRLKASLIAPLYKFDMDFQNSISSQINRITATAFFITSTSPANGGRLLRQEDLNPQRCTAVPFIEEVEKFVYQLSPIIFKITYMIKLAAPAVSKTAALPLPTSVAVCRLGDACENKQACPYAHFSGQSRRLVKNDEIEVLVAEGKNGIAHEN